MNDLNDKKKMTEKKGARKKVVKSPEKTPYSSDYKCLCPCKEYIVEDIKNVVRSYADVTKESQKEVIQQAALSQSSKTVVESVVRQLDADKVEREKRRCNLVVLSAPEPSKDLSKEQKIAEDNQFCCSVLEIPSSNIEACWRAGKIDESKPEYRRPLIIKLKSEGLAQEWTNNGVGLKTANGHWINRDLCAADRKANFLSRQERRKRMEKKK
ncbi:hypothetical protein ACHWQZ_G011241 [Mnemiopsis leidyi]